MIDDIFYKKLDYIDLHGYDRDMARVLTNDFINDSIVLKKDKIIIIHGIGNGIVRNSVHETLSKNKHVNEFWIDNNNAGITVVKLKLDKH